MVPESNSEAVALEITFRIAPVNRVEFLQTIDSLMLSEAEIQDRGTQICFEQVGTTNTFLWRECWGSRGKLEERLQSSAIRTLLGAIGVLGELGRLEILTRHDESESSLGGA